MNTRWIRRSVLVSFAFAISFAVCRQDVLAQNLDDSVVRIFVTKREVDQSSPWQNEEIMQNSFHGVVVEGKAVLTTAFAMQNAVEIELLRFGESRKFPLQIKFVDYEVNLALLVPIDPAGVAGLVPLKFTDEISLDSAVSIMKAKDNNQLVSVAGTLQEVSIYTSVTSEYSFATYLVKTQQTALGWAEPIIRSGAVAALCSGQDSQYLHAIPGSIINHFLRDVQAGNYRGFPSIGIELDRLTSPEMRELLGAEKIKHGVRISSVETGTNFSELLKKDDVLVAMDGVKINENGYYIHPVWGKVHLKYLLNRKIAGEKTHLEILRQGQPLQFEAVLTRFDSNATRIRSFREEISEPHLIFGGVVIRELTIPFLKQWGKDWQSTAPYQMLYEFHFNNKTVEHPEKNRVLIISRVLADEYNRGYADIKNSIIQEINGLTVRSMADVRAALAAPTVRGGRQFARIELAYEDGEIVLSYDGLAAVHKRIVDTFNITSAESFYHQ